jgi:hypothetical protein
MTDTTKRITQLPHLSKAQNTALAAVVDALKGLQPEDAQEVLDHAVPIWLVTTCPHVCPRHRWPWAS